MEELKSIMEKFAASGWDYTRACLKIEEMLNFCPEIVRFTKKRKLRL